MASAALLDQARIENWRDEEAVERVRGGEIAAPRCFEFHASRCDRVVKNVFATLGLDP